MTNNTSSSSRPVDGQTVPPWLDLDAIVSPEIRHEIAGLVGEGAQYALEVRKWATFVYRVVQRHNAAVTAACNQGAQRVDLHDLIDPLTGLDRLLELAQQIADDTGHITGSVADSPSWAAEIDRHVAAEATR